MPVPHRKVISVLFGVPSLLLTHLVFKVVCFCCYLLLPNFNYFIVLENPFFKALVRNINLSLSILYSVFPIAFIVASIYPMHLTISASHICLVLSFINIATSPYKGSLAPFLIVPVFPIVPITASYAFLPRPFPVSKPVDEVTFEIAAIIPIIFTIA